MDSQATSVEDSSFDEDHNRILPIAFLVSLFLILSPLLFIFVFHENVVWNIDVSEGLVFTATVGVLSRIFIRTGLRVGIRTGVRSGIRTGVRSVIRGGVRSIISKDQVAEKKKASWLKRWIFVSPVEYKEQSQGFFGEIIRILITIIILSLSLFLVALFRTKESNQDLAYIIGNRLAIDLLALSVVIFILYIVEKFFTEVILKRDFCFYLTPDGILVQILFTFGLSFLPLVHDTEMRSKEDEPEIRPRAFMGLVGIGSLIITALVAKYILFSITGNPFFSSLADFAILFALLFSFPSQPYEGGDIFAWNKLVSLLVFSLSLLLSVYILSIDLANLI